MRSPSSLLPTVSVILPTYSGLRHLGATLDSVLNQDFSDHELIVVDDGSTDGTAAWVRQNYPTVLLLERSNGGISRARNTGLEAAHGRYIAFLDHDDLWHPQKLAQQARWLDELGCVFGEFRAWSGETEPGLDYALPYPPIPVPELSG